MSVAEVEAALNATTDPHGGVFSRIMSNQFFAAGVGVMGVGFGMTILRQGVKQAAIFARRRYFVVLEIPSKDKAYHWVLQWIAKKGSKNTQHLSVGIKIHQKKKLKKIKKNINFFY